jgi:two-component system cell cycle sensor histidine kinase/response regulator CckA
MRVLVIDDDPDHRELIIAKIRKVYPEAEFIEVVRQAMLDDVLQRGGPVDAVLTDFRLQWSDGLKVLAQVRARFPHTPVVMVTDTGSEEVAAAGMKAGLADYVLKGHLHRLALAFKESLEKNRLRRDREEALERLRKSEERYRIISELSSDYAYSYRIATDGTVTLDWITQAFTRITGYLADELQTGVLLPIVHPDDRALIERGRDELLAGRPYSAEIRIVTKDRHVRWLSDVARPVWDNAQNRVVCIYGAGEDITERKRSEEERAQLIREQAARAEAEASERRYRSLAEAIPQIVWTARPDGHVDYHNRRWFEYTGLTEQESTGKDPWRAIIHPDDGQGHREQWAESVRTGNVFEFECRFRRASDGSDRWHLCRAIPLRDPDGRIAKWFGTCTDIDDQRRSGEAMRQAQKLESIGLLAGGVAHDFNNLLTGILGNTSLVLDELPAESRLRPLLENVMLASERAADLTRQLLAYSGKGRFFVQPRDLSVLVREIGSLIQSSIPKKVQLRLDLAPDLPLVDIDSAQIQQLIMNLVINGAEAIGEEHSGVVTVRTLLRNVDAHYIANNHFAADPAPPGSYVAIQVRDTGCGMDEEVRSHIFDPFFTTKFTGRGLGLAAALGIVRGHNGSIRIETEPGKGTLFEVLLPAGAAERGEEKPAEPRRELRGAGSVLVVDDEELVRGIARTTLEHYGYTVIEAANGREAVRKFRQLADEISLVLLDMMMPVMGGEEALVEIRAIRPGVPVIGSSGYSESVAKERFGGSGLASFLQKPYSARVLADRVKRVIDQTQAIRAGRPV